MYRLCFLSGRYEGKRLVVRQALTLVGSDPDCHLRLADDGQLRPRHARFEVSGTGVYLESLEPAARVERNGLPVTGAVRLAHNDLLVLGATRLQFQELIAPQPRVRPSPGALQPLTMGVIAAILVVEAALLAFLADWPRRIIRPEVDAADLARAEAIRAARIAEQGGETGAVKKVSASATVVTLPGTTPAEPPTNAAARPAEIPAAATTSAPPPAVLQTLNEADFTPVDTNTAAGAPPPPSANPVLDQAEKNLAEAVTAIQFADFAKASRLLGQIHQAAPGFLPAYVEHARLLEARGDLDAAQQRWTQLLGLAPADSPFRAQAQEERDRLAQIQARQSTLLRTPRTVDVTSLPRQIRILPPDLQKMPSDTDIAEMRVLNATLEAAPGAAGIQNAAVQVFITFYDTAPNGQVRPTRAITPASPIVLGRAFADSTSVPLNATYVVPRALRPQEARESGQASAFYGYTLHVFAGQVLQDAFAKPRKLLDQPIHIPANVDPDR